MELSVILLFIEKNLKVFILSTMTAQGVILYIVP